jgi:predicted DsbA family dithiol-disulfide isomerase
MAEVTFYHSVVCPKCQLSKIALASVLKEFPEITLRKVEYFGNLRSAKAAGVRSIPTLVSGDKILQGVVFTRKQLRGFFASL